MKVQPRTLLYREALTGSDWLAARLDGAGAIRRGPISKIVEPGENVVILLPGDDAVARVVELPNMRDAERREAAISILEPDLAEPIDTLMLGCFASANRQTLAVWVSKSRLAAWLGAITTAGANVVAAVPEWALLDRVRDVGVAEAWCVGEKTWLISKRGIAICVENALASGILNSVCVEEGSGGLRVNGAPADVSVLGFDEIPGYVRGEPELSWLALWKRVGKVEQMDLRRVVEVTSPAQTPAPLRWLVATFAFACLAAGAFVGVELNALEAERDRWDANSVAVFRAAFPNEARVVDVKRQMRLKLRSAGASVDSGPDTLELLDGFARVAESTDGVTVTGIQYESGRLVVSVRAQAISDIERLRTAATKTVPELAPRLQQLVATAGEAQGELHLGADR